MLGVLMDNLKGLRSFPRGIHPPYRKKYAQAEPIKLFNPQQTLMIPLLQHIGATCTPTVLPRQAVRYGQKIADKVSPVTAPIHATLAGKTGPVQIASLPNGRRVPVIPLNPMAEGEALPANFLEQYLDYHWDKVEPSQFEPEAICATIRQAGVVGMGGACFPTYIKLKRNYDRPIDTLIVNGCECEPYLTSDHRLMLETPEAIVVGAQLAAHACGARRVVIAIEDNKPDAIEAMQRVVKGRPKMELMACATKYPMGGERQLVFAVMGRTVPSAPKGLPLNVGVVLINCATAHSIARAVVHNLPLTHRVVTVTGAGVSKPGNWLVPFGTMFSELIAHCGGVTTDAFKVLAGGPMMGPTVPNLNVPVVKGTSGITVMTLQETVSWQESPCIRCSACVDNCPLHLSPTKIAHAVKFRDYELAAKYDMNACCECGCCAYVCPANIPLVQYIRAGKSRSIK